MQIQENSSLKPYNTFGIAAQARYFSSFNTLGQLQELLAFSKKSSVSNLLLGGGSNMLFTKDYDGMVLKNELMGIVKIREDEDFVWVKAGAGENWHSLVQHCISHNWAGLENLSLIPGCVGASPMQNIGAYGVEVEQLFWQLEALHLQEDAVQAFNRDDCAFGYRESIFKNKYRNQFAILNVTFRLRKKPVFNISYGAIEEELNRMGVTELSLRAVSDAVVRIRQSKLPNPAEIGNAGSFFKNPSIDKSAYDQLKSAFPGVVGYANPDGSVKLAAGWLIEQCGWKGYRKGDAGCHARQALVLVNYGNASGKEIFDLSARIADSVYSKFGVQLEREVNII